MKIKTVLVAVIALLVVVTVSCNKEEIPLINTAVLLVLNKIEASENNEIRNNFVLDSLFVKLVASRNDSVNRNFLFKIDNIYYGNNNLEKYLSVSHKILKLAKAAKDSSHIAKSLYYIGDYYDAKSILDSAYNYYYKSEKIYMSIKDSAYTGRLILNKAGILFDNGNFSESEIELIRAIRILLPQKDDRLLYECYNIMGLNLIELNDYSKSLEYFELAQNQLEKLKEENSSQIHYSKSSCLNNIGNVYLKQEQFSTAQDFYKKALLISKLKKINPSLYAKILSNLGYATMKNGNAVEAKKMFFESYRIRDSIQSDAGIISSKYYIGQYYLNQKDTVQAIANLASCYQLSKKLNKSPDILNSLKLLTEIDTKNKNYYAQKYFKINDSLQHLERITRNKFARIEFETDQVEEENLILLKKNTLITLVAFAIFIFMGILFLSYWLRTKYKELNYIKNQQNQNQEIYQLLLKQQTISDKSRNEERNRIAKELHDGIVNNVFTTRFNIMQLKTAEEDVKLKIISELKNTELEIRNLSHKLNKNLNFNDSSMITMITNLVASQNNEWNTKFSLKIDKFINWNQIDSETKMNSFRIIQEVLQNVNKYAKAKLCVVMVLKTADKTTIRIWDNGVGFNPNKRRNGIGLKNIKERTETIKGTIQINSTLNKGTTVEVIF